MTDDGRWDAVTSRFRSKPVDIEAVRFDGTTVNGMAIVDWIHKTLEPELQMGRANSYPLLAWYDSRSRMSYDGWGVVAIRTLDGTMYAKPGDYVVRGVLGEFYPVPAATFEATYDRIGEVS